MKNAETKPYSVLKRQFLKGEWRDVDGDPVELTEKEARFRLKSGSIEPATGDDQAKATKPTAKKQEAKAD